MSAFGWITAARRAPLASWLRRSHRRRNEARARVLSVESLETIELLSRASLAVPRPTIQTAALTPQSVTIAAAAATSTTQSVNVPLVNVDPTLTNFTASFNPSIPLFNPALGQLTAVHLDAAVGLVSRIKSQNTSSSSPAAITAYIGDPPDGSQTNTTNYSITGLPTTLAATLPRRTTNTVTVPPNLSAPPFNFTGSTTVVFGFPVDYSNTGENQQPPVISSISNHQDYSAASDLAFFTASANRGSITPQLTVNAQAGASAPNGNTQTDVATRGGGQIIVRYEYIPACPTVVNLVRYGIHQQPTQLQLFFNGPVNVADAQNTANYSVTVPNRSGSFTGPGVTHVAVTSAVYNATTNSVILTTARRLNVHYQFQLDVKLPCNNGNTVVIQFGGKNSLGGFTNPHKGNVFVPVANGHVVRR